jgi:hypothetical protein
MFWSVAIRNRFIALWCASAPDAAEEVAIAAFGHAYEKLGQFEGRSGFVTAWCACATSKSTPAYKQPRIWG